MTDSAVTEQGKNLGSGRKGHGQAIHAVAQPGRWWAVVEHMAQVPAAAPAMHLFTQHA